MLRAALTAVVLASAVACGSGSSGGPAVVAGAAAGDVVEVSGSVTAIRDGKSRPLAAGDVVSGDDVIDTATDGRVTIKLHHNKVTWTLGPGSKEAVGKSLAWSQKMTTETAAGPTGERSGAAGRHAEREAADTAASGEMAQAAEPAPVAAAAPAAAAAPPAAVADMPAPGAAPVPPPPPPEKEAAVAVADEAPPRAATARNEKMARSAPSDDDLLGGEGLTGGVGEAKAFGGGGAGGGGGGGGDLGTIGTIGHGSGTGEGRGLGAGAGARAKPTEKGLRVVSVSGGLEQSIVLRIVRSQQGKLFTCHAGAGGRTTVRLLIAADGKVSRAVATGGTATTNTCIQDVLKKVSFPAGKGVTQASLVVETAP
jgi:hypothetical protein